MLKGNEQRVQSEDQSMRAQEAAEQERDFEKRKGHRGCGRKTGMCCT